MHIRYTEIPYFNGITVRNKQCSFRSQRVSENIVCSSMLWYRVRNMRHFLRIVWVQNKIAFWHSFPLMVLAKPWYSYVCLYRTTWFTFATLYATWSLFGDIYLCGGVHEYLLQRIVTMFLESGVILQSLAFYCIFTDMDYYNAFTCPRPNSKWYAHLYKTQLSITFLFIGR